MNEAEPGRLDASQTVKVCPECHAVVQARARFCEACGHRLEAPAPAAEAIAAEPASERQRVAGHVEAYESRATQSLVRELYKRHVSLIRTTERRTGELATEIDRVGGELQREADNAPSAERSVTIQALLEELEEVGDRGDEIQHEFNNQSESLDEEFLDRAAELEVDVELPPELREGIQAELARLREEMAALEARIAVVGEQGQRLLREPQGRWFSLGRQRQGARAGWVLTAGLAGTAWAAWRLSQEGRMLLDLLPLLGPAVGLPFALWLVTVRRRS
jgi:hypothetical protein